MDLSICLYLCFMSIAFIYIYISPLGGKIKSINQSINHWQREGVTEGTAGAGGGGRGVGGVAS